MSFDPWRHYLRGLMFEALKRPHSAVAEYRLALHHNPDFIQAARCLGYLHAAQKSYGEAEPYLLQITQLAPKDAETWFNLGYVREQAGNKPGAIEAFRSAVDIKPKLDRAWFGLGLAHASLGQHPEAAQALEKAAALQPMNAHAWYNLGMAYHHCHQPEKVVEVVQHLHRFDPVMTRHLIQDAERADLAHLVKDLAV
jgi:tetratricopeptide (TPR) repeat protein